ncbi:uncharacterized protein F4807DRAFT_117884 [Annulohypoxylon truncatum]|uniref:uncharacterized protein n=1 Tax=Annulohypoxylon truncatum TaxID=327061 RepID=UPI002007DC03|nr:uncharacterized protein F4807DRAFT_117884 [Annulohypoxylon truncatum]KAI1214197.1 hypothetical protein F4807DRAFT_117884 [Annulohypoxylon truncatum]
MRLDVSRFGILACLSGLAAAEGGDAGGAKAMRDDVGTTSTSSTASNAVIELEALPTPPVYVEGKGVQNLAYTYGPGITDVTVTAVNLKRYSDNGTVAMGDISNGSTTSAGLHTDEAILGRQVDNNLPPFSFPVSNGSVTLIVPDTATGLSKMYGSNAGLPLYYEFEWDNSTSSGKSYSQLIAVALSDSYQAAADAITSTGKESNPAYVEDVQQDATNPTSISSTTGSTAAETSSASAVASSGSGGLSPGAIAGIAVGCAVAFILIVAFIVWFFFFRRRSNRDQAHGGSDFATNSGTRAMVLEKEGTGSPQSSYPNDGGRLHDPDAYASYEGSKAPPAPGAAFATNSTTDLASIGQASTTRANTPPAYQSRYAHLIEEGMTEEEIRRLEEEERHLDEAIEDAGRNSRRDTH